MTTDHETTASVLLSELRMGFAQLKEERAADSARLEKWMSEVKAEMEMVKRSVNEELVERATLKAEHTALRKDVDIIVEKLDRFQWLLISTVLGVLGTIVVAIFKLFISVTP